MFKELVNRLSDPTLTWNVRVSYGGRFVRRQAITTQNPQTLHVCDEIICVPTRFSEYLSWHDGSGGSLTRIFPNHPEAWDHTRETNPTTSAPYDGIIKIFVGYLGYLIVVDLTDGTTKSRVHIAKRSYPELQVLIFNKGTITIRVNDPPATHGLSRITSGIAGAGYVDLGQNQYVVYYKSSVPGIDSTNGVFSVSPIGTGKRWPYEAYVFGHWDFNLGFNLYTGLKAPKDISYFGGFSAVVYGGSFNRGGINASGIRESQPDFNIYDSDPYCSQRTWAQDNYAYYHTTGWAEDEAGNVKYMYISSYTVKHTTKDEQRAETFVGVLYDADLDEFFAVRYVRPLVNIYSYGRAGAVIQPFTRDGEGWVASATVSRAISQNDALLEWTTPAPYTWTYYEAYALLNVYGSPVNEGIAGVALGIYTDDTEVSIPTDVRQAFGVGGTTAEVKRVGLQVKPFMDRTLYAGKTYAVVTRLKKFPPAVTGDEFKAWATKKYPVRITDSEWNTFLSILPLTARLVGVPSGSISVSVSPSTAPPGGYVMVEGSAPEYRNKDVYVALVDPDTYTVVASTVTQTDAYGNYGAQLYIPTNITPGKTYKVYVVVSPEQVYYPR